MYTYNQGSASESNQHKHELYLKEKVTIELVSTGSGHISPISVLPTGLLYNSNVLVGVETYT